MIKSKSILYPLIWPIILTILLFTGSLANGQTVNLPDTNFRNVLQRYYPSLMTGDQLNVGAANSFTNDLFVKNANISDLTGIEHFTSVYKIDASGNKINYVPDLSANQNLEYLYLNFNNLSNIDFLLNNKSLLQIQLFNNQLTNIPKFSGFTNLIQLFLSNNKIEKIEDVTELVNLLDFQFGNNLLDSLPDLSQNIKLNSLHFHQNSIVDVTELSKLPNLQFLYCWSNKIKDLNSLNENTTLRTLISSDNELNDLPDLGNKPALTSLELANNYLTFEDLLPISKIENLGTFTYAPQHAAGNTTFLSVRALNPLFLDINADEMVNSNLYTWLKNGVPIQTNNSGNFQIPVASPSDSGVYSALITNPALPLLTISQMPWKVSILPCMDLLNYGYRILSKDCDEGTTIQAEIITEGSSLPLQYTLINKNSGDSINSSSAIINNLSAGKYTFKISDQRSCQLTVDEKLTIFNTAGCNPVIAPTGQGQENTYFIEGKGEVKIYDVQGNLIKTLTAPAVWDGTTTDGKLADAGYYVITLNNQKLTNISVLR